jgi:hypothetical protein
VARRRRRGEKQVRSSRDLRNSGVVRYKVRGLFRVFTSFRLLCTDRPRLHPDTRSLWALYSAVSALLRCVVYLARDFERKLCSRDSALSGGDVFAQTPEARVGTAICTYEMGKNTKMKEDCFACLICERGEE